MSTLPPGLADLLLRRGAPAAVAPLTAPQAYALADFAVRDLLPRLCDLLSLQREADCLRSLPEITAAADLQGVPTLVAAQRAAVQGTIAAALKAALMAEPEQTAVAIAQVEAEAAEASAYSARLATEPVPSVVTDLIALIAEVYALATPAAYRPRVGAPSDFAARASAYRAYIAAEVEDYLATLFAA